MALQDLQLDNGNLILAERKVLSQVDLARDLGGKQMVLDVGRGVEKETIPKEKRFAARLWPKPVLLPSHTVDFFRGVAAADYGLYFYFPFYRNDADMPEEQEFCFNYIERVMKYLSFPEPGSTIGFDPPDYWRFDPDGYVPLERVTRIRESVLGTKIDDPWIAYRIGFRIIAWDNIAP
jgi:hypothetical protein